MSILISLQIFYFKKNQFDPTPPSPLSSPKSPLIHPFFPRSQNPKLVSPLNPLKSNNNKSSSSSLLSLLKRAVKNVGFLLNLGIHRWRIAAMLRTASGTKIYDFIDRLGLMGYTDDTNSKDQPGSSRGIQRTINGLWEDDVDNKADIFITNFHRQLRMERQISLEIRYFRGNSFESTITSP